MASKKKLQRKLRRADLHIDRLIDVVGDLSEELQAQRDVNKKLQTLLLNRPMPSPYGGVIY